MIVFTVIGVLFCGFVLGAIGAGLALLIWDHFCAFWMLVRCRAVQKRQGVLERATLRQWANSVVKLTWRFGDCRLESGGVIIPRRPFERLRHSSWR